MKFTCNQKIFAEALSTVQRALPAITPHPILEGIYIETVSDVIKLKATDTDLTIELHIEAFIEESGSIIVPAKMFTDIIRKFPDKDVSVSIIGNRIRIECLSSVVNLFAIPGEYPDTEQTQMFLTIECKQSIFKKMVQQTVFAAAPQDPLRPEFTGVLIDIKRDELNLVCVDGYRLALARNKFDKKNIDTLLTKDIIVPSKTMNEVARISPNLQENMDIKIGERHIVFDFGLLIIYSKLISGKFLDYKHIISSYNKTSIKVERVLLYKSIDRASVLSKDDKNNLIDMGISENKLSIRSTSEYGDISDEVTIDLTGNEMEISFNSRYLLEALKNIDDNEICINFKDKNSPCIIKPIENDSYAYMILPVRTGS